MIEGRKSLEVPLNRFHVAAPSDYDRELCLIPQAMVRFLQVTQPQAWKALKGELGADAEIHIVKRVRGVIEKKGTLHALRKGVDESGCHFDLCFFSAIQRPQSGPGKTLSGEFFSKCSMTRIRPVASKN
jgi:type I restriction enzyme R subunit